MTTIFGNKAIPKSTNLPTIENRDFDFFSYIIETLISFENLAQENITTHMQSTYIAAQDNNVEILREGFGDFLKSCGEFFIALWNKLKELFDKVLTYIKSFIMDFDTFLKNNQEKILSRNVEFKIEGFEYDFKNDIPNLELISRIITDYNNELREVLKNKNKGTVIALRDQYNTPTFFNKMRAKALNKSGEIASQNYYTELFKEFRSGKKDKSTINIDNTRIRKYVTEYSTVKRIYSDLLKERDDISGMLSELKTFFDEGVQIYYRGEQKVMAMRHLSQSNSGINTTERDEEKFDSEFLTVLNSFYNYKFHQAKELTHIITISITTKITALKEALSMYKSVIRSSVIRKEV